MKVKETLPAKATANSETEAANEYCLAKSLVGDLILVADAEALTGLYFAGCAHIPAARKQWKLNNEHPVLLSARKQLQEYFAGERKTFSLPLHWSGTDFQKNVWQAIAGIPFGETISYSDLAQRAGKPDAIRAAGTSTGRNPISIIVPCHRVVGKNGSLHGFAGGLDRKRRLLSLENSELELRN